MKKVATLTAVFALALSVALGTAQAFSLLELEEAVSVLQQFDPEIEPLSNDPSKDFVVGGFQDAFGFNNGISVRSGPAGEDPTGMASATDPQTGFRIRVRAVCLAVLGNVAAVGWVGTFVFEGEEFAFDEIDVFRDGGPGGTLDGFNAFASSQFGGVQNCALALPFGAGALPLQAGNILVNDAP